MALTNIRGRDVKLAVEKTINSVATPVVIGCSTDMGLSINTESDEATCVASGNFKEYEPGQTDWTISASLNVRQATDDATANPPQTDATDNVTAENMVDLQLNQTMLKVSFTLGTGTGRARYSGSCFITKSDFKGQQKGLATYAVSLQGSGELVKSLTS